MDEISIHVTGFLSMGMCLTIEVRVMVRDCRRNLRGVIRQPSTTFILSLMAIGRGHVSLMRLLLSVL